MKRFRMLVAAGLVAVLAFSVVGCSDKNVAARVNGDEITIDELNKQVDQLKKQYPQMFDGADGEGRLLDFKQRLLDNLINQKLVTQAAEEKGIKVTDADVSKQVDQLKTGFTDTKQFEAALKSAGYTVETLKVQVKDQLVTQKLIESLASEGSASQAEIQQYYDKNKAQFYQKAAKRPSHILFKPEDKTNAEKVLNELKEGAEFSVEAKKYSTDTATAAKGGDLGWPSTPYVTEFQTALDKLKVGETSDLVKTPYGWHIIKVTDERKAKQQTLAEVKDQIKQILVQQRRADAYQQFIDKLRKKAKIEIVLDELKTSTTTSKTSGSKTATGTPSK
ncbi:MAG TPA: SurA N-terminal domain-containing protein [Coriobacteriia bacterium]|nr:SurA N-terminal domain-containing protein [Coriobacteriia bacterium]